MWKTKCRNLSTSFFLSQIKSRTFATHSVLTQKRIYLVSVNGHFVSSNCRNDSKVQNFIQGPILSAVRIPTSNPGVRHFSSVETLDNLSKTLQFPIDFFQQFALSLHSFTQLPWWASIILYTTILRISFGVPLYIYQNHLVSRIQNIRNEIQGHEFRLKKDVAVQAQQNNWSEARERIQHKLLLREEKRKLFVIDNCHPLKMVTIVVMQMGIFVFQTLAIRNLCNMMPLSDAFAVLTHMELSVGGFGWFQNLTQSDQYLILPFISAFTIFCTIQTSRLLYPSTTRFLKILKKIMVVVFPLFSIVVSSYMPTAVVLTWVTTNILTYIELLLFATPKVRSFLAFPKTDHDFKQPPLTIIREALKAKRQSKLK